MFLSEIISRRVVVGAIGAGAVTGTLLCATAGTAGLIRRLGRPTAQLRT
jgi:hypothetical protein